MLDGGDALTSQLGRKFGYTESDFLEAYFGKDNARDANSEFGEGTVFGFNESFKKKYPIDKYQKMPSIEAQRK